MDNTVALNYWIEEWNTSGDSRIWMKVPDISANSSETIYMYYNNSEASSESNGGMTFELYHVSGIKGFWHFDEDSWSGASEEVKDETGVNDGTAYGGATTTADGKFKRAGSFDGTNDYADFGNDESLNAQYQTIEFWVNYDCANHGFIMTKDVMFGDRGWSFVHYGTVHGNRIYFDTGNLPSVIHIAKGDACGKWHHIAASVGPSGVYCYLDGILNGSDISHTTGVSQNNNIVQIGCGSRYSNNDHEQFLDGTIDEVRIYNRALSAEEISTIYNNYMEKMGSYYNVRKYTSPEPTTSLGAEETSSLFAGTYNWSWNTRTYADGNHTIKVIAYDIGENNASDKINVTVSYAPPSTPVITSPINNTLTNQNTINVSGTADAGTTAEVFVNGTSQGTSVTDEQETFTFTTVNLTEGLNAITATASDGIQTSPHSDPVNVIMDTIPPTVTITSPVNGTICTSTSVNLNYSVNEPTVWAGYSLDGAPTVTLEGNTTLTGLSVGAQYLTVYANDTAGNMNFSTVWFTVNVSMQISATLTPNLTSVKGDATVSGHVNLSDGTPVPDNPVNIYLNETTISTTQTESNGDYNSSFQAPETLGIYDVKVNTTYQGLYAENTQLLSVTSLPAIGNITINPPYPNAVDDVTVSARITDDGTILSADLFYSQNNINFTRVPMSGAGDNYSATIPATTNTTTIYYYIEATDDTNFSTASPIQSYIADADPPEFSDNFIDPKHPTAFINVNASLTITDNVGVKNATLYYSYNDTTYTPIELNNEGNRYFALIPAPNKSSYVYYYVSAYDLSRNRASSSNYSYYAGEIDLIVSDISTGGIFIEGSAVSINATVTNIGPDNVVVNTSAGVFVDDVLIGEVEIPGLDANQSANITVDWQTGVDSAGNHRIKVKADYDEVVVERNESNNERTVTIFISPDTFTPFFSNILQSPVDISESTTGAVTISVNITDVGTGVNTSSVKLFYNVNFSTDKTVPMTGIAADLYKAAITEDWNALCGKTITYYISASDNAGNTNITDIIVDYIDPVNDIPQVTIISPNATTAWNTNGTIKWAITDEDSTEFSSTLYYKNSTSTWIFLAQTNDTEYEWSTSTLNDGRYQIHVNVSDGIDVGNDTSAVFKIDHTPPYSITLDSPINNVFINSDPVPLKFKAADNVADTLRCDLYLDGNLNASTTAQNNTRTTASISGIAEGEHNWSVSCFDEVLLQNTSSIENFTIDRTKPVIDLNKPVNHSLFDIDTVIFTFSVSDNMDDVLDCTLFLNGNPEASINAPNGTSAETTVANLSSSSYDWYVKCKDNATNENTSEFRKFTIATDLAIFHADIVINPKTPLQGTNTTINVTVHNLGSVDAEKVNVTVHDENNSFIVQKLISVPAHGINNFSTVWDLKGLSYGNHTAIVEIHESPYSDSDLSNNNASSSITISEDMIPPVFSTIIVEPTDIREDTENVVFTVDITDEGVGVNKDTARLAFSINDTHQNKSLNFVEGNRFSITLTRDDSDWDLNQGKNLTFYASASDLNDNFNSSPPQIEYIDIVNDVPVVTIYAPDNTSVWAGTKLIKWSWNNDNEGPCYSTVYYWKPHVWAPPYPDAGYWQQGVWMKLSDVGTNTSYLWNTVNVALNGTTKIKVNVTDGVHNVSELSDAFIIDNTKVLIFIDNYYHPPSHAYIVNTTPVVLGRVSGINSKIAAITVNNTNFTLTQIPVGHVEAAYAFTSLISIVEPFAVTIHATDEAGNRGEIEAAFVVDNASPVIHATTISPAYTNATVKIAVDVTDDYGIMQVNASVPVSLSERKNSTLSLNDSSGLYEGQFTAPVEHNTYSVSIGASDVVGNSVSATTNITVSQGPELAISPEDIVFSPNTTSTGNIVNISAAIHNIGYKDATDVNVSFYKENLNNLIGTKFIDITANSTFMAVLSWDTTGSAGNVTILVSIENSTGVYETHYSDNRASRTYFVNAPDLVINGSDITFIPESPVYAGEVVAVYANSTNLRAVNASDVRVNFYAGGLSRDELIGYDIIDVPGNSSAAATVDWHTAGYLFEQTIYVEVNPDNEPPELNTTNNLAGRTYYIEKYVAEQTPETLTFEKTALPTMTTAKIRGMTSGNFNNDTRIDFVLGTETGEIILYENVETVLTEGNRSKYVHFTPRLIAELSPRAYGMTSGDYYNDSFQDIVAGTEDGKVLLLNNTLGNFSIITLFDEVWDEAYGLTTADYDGDGDLDLVVGNKLGHVSLYLNDNMRFNFSKIITTREQPYGMTSGDYNLDGNVDVIVGDRLGQLDRVVNEGSGTFRSYLFADIGAFAHGLTTADFDFNGKLDIAAIGFDGDITLFYSRGEGIVMDPLIIGKSQNTYGITAGDYDQDNDIDIVIGTDRGDVYLLLNNLYIKKSASRNPMPTSRTVTITTDIENPWARKMQDLNVTEEGGGSLRLVENAYAPKVSRYEYFYADMHLYGTPKDEGRYDYHCYLKFPNSGCIQKYDKWTGKWSYCSESFTFEGEYTNNALSVTNILDIFGLNGLYQREKVKYSYVLRSNESDNVSVITTADYRIAGKFVTYPTSYLLSDDVSNVNDGAANIKNFNPSENKSDRGFYDLEIRAPDFTITDMSYYHHNCYYDNKWWTCVGVNAFVKNLNNISIQDVSLTIEIEGEVVGGATFDSDALSGKWLNVGGLHQPNTTINITAIVNPDFSIIESNYSNNTRTIIYKPPPPVSYEHVDLVPVNITFDHIPIEGESFKVNVTVENRGVNTSTSEILYFVPGSISQDWKNKTVECYSGSPYYDKDICSGFYSDSPPYPKINYDIPIPPGGNHTFNATFGTANEHRSSQGTWIYNVLVYAGGHNQIDINTTNNAISPLLTVLPSQVDLTMYYGYWRYGYCEYIDIGGSKCYYPISLSNPDSNTISMSIREFDSGGEDADNHSLLVYYDNNMSNVVYILNNLTLPGHTYKDIVINANWSTVPPGDHLLYFYFDSFNDVNESNENDNIFTKQFYWKELAAKQITYSIQNPSVGDLVYIKALISNEGDIRTGDFNAVLYIDGNYVANQTVSLLAHEQKWISYLWQVPPSQIANHEVKVVLDPEDVITHENEDNNIVTSKLPVVSWDMNVLSAGHEHNYLGVYRNSNLDWLSDDFNLSKIAMEFNTVPRFVDLDADGDLDLVAGSLAGTLNSFKNSGSASVPAWTPTDWKFPGIDTGFRSAPAFADIDRDGDYDMVVGNVRGALFSYENSGSATTPRWRRNETIFNFTNINMRLNVLPAFVDLDSDGDFDLVLGTEDGDLAGYENIGTAYKPAWVLADWNLSVVIVGSNSAPAFADLDGDSDYDLVVGAGDGTLTGYENTGSATTPAWNLRDWNLQIQKSKIKFDSSAVPVFADLNADSYPDLVVGNNNEQYIGLQQGYTYPVKVKVVNYADHDLSIYKDKLQFLNNTSLKKVTGIYMDNGCTIPPSGSKMIEYMVTVPREMPVGTLLGVTTENRVSMAQAWTNNPELGGYTTDIYAASNTTFEIGGSYRLFVNGTMSELFNCGGRCPVFNLSVGRTNTIVTASGASLLAYEKDRELKFEVIPPEKPAVDIIIEKLGEFYNLKPGYVEDVEFVIENNNVVPYNVNRIVFELEKDGKMYDLYTDTDGFTLPAKNITSKKYKIYVPEGVPLDATFHLKIMRKFGLPDQVWHRSNLNIWDNDTIYVDEYFWGSQIFTDYNEYSKEDDEETYLRKHIWLDSSLQKAEFWKRVEQECGWFHIGPPAGITTYINRTFYTTIYTSCIEGRPVDEYGWTPLYYDLHPGDNEFTLQTYGPKRWWEVNLYDLIAWNRVLGATVETKPAFKINLTSIGQNESGFLRRQYEEPVNITVYNNDDNPITVEVVQFDLITPANRTIRLLTDLKPREYAGGTSQTHTYTLVMPDDVPLGSKLRVQAERVYQLPDKLWLRDHETTKEKLLSEETKDYGWGDTLPTTQSSNYRKHVFAPANVTRMEVIFGGGVTTKLYLNGIYQGHGYTGWSPVATDSGLREGENNLISVIGAIPDTESRIYTGQRFAGGEVVEPAEDVFYTVFGIREKSYEPEREKFRVYPGEDITARVKIDNFYSRTMEFRLRLYVVDFETLKETTLDTRTITIPGKSSKYVEIDTRIPKTVSNNTKLQLYSTWNELVADKAWSRASNINDDVAQNTFMDDSSWGVVSLSSASEKAKYFRKHLWVDSLTEDVQLSLSGVEKVWVNGLEVPISGWGSGFHSLTGNEITKSDENVIALKARNYDVDANIKLIHFVPVKTTDLDIITITASNLSLMPDNLNCTNITECNYFVTQGEKVPVNFTIRNTGELFARTFNLTVYAKNVETGVITTLVEREMTMPPYSKEESGILWNTTEFAGRYDLVIYADKEDIIIESSELNNYKTLHIYVNAKPEIQYLNMIEQQGFGEPVDIEANVTDEDGNLRRVRIEITTPENETQIVTMSNASASIYRYTYVNYIGGRYNVTVKARDALGLHDELSGSFELYDSLLLNVKTERDRYYYGEHIQLSEDSVIKNVEDTNTSVTVSLKIQYYKGTGTWIDEFISLTPVRVLAASEIALRGIWTPWDTIKSHFYNGTYRVVVDVVDPDNSTIINRDGSLALAYDNFTVTNVNIPPIIAGIPDKYVLENFVPKEKWIHLLDYVTDSGQDPRGFKYTIVNQSNESLIRCSIIDKYVVTCSAPALNQTGYSDINVSAYDGQFYGYDVFRVTVVPTLYYEAPVITVNFTPPLNSSGMWQTSENDTGVYVTTVTVSDGFTSDSQNVTITILERLITFVPPTPENNSLLRVNHTFINVTANENLSIALLEWNGVNETMEGAGMNWYLNKTNLTDGVYTFKAYGNAPSGNWRSTETRIVEVKATVPDTTPPTIAFVPPTPINNSIVTVNHTFINITANEDLSIALLEWNGVNETMDGAGMSWYLNRTNLADGIYTFKVYGNDTSDNWNSTRTRIVEVNVTKPDTTPPVITNVTATDITTNSARITWDTDEESDSLVKYGIESGNYTLSALNTSFALEHRVDLTGLSENTTYYYAVNSTDRSGNSAQSAEYRFTTAVAVVNEPPEPAIIEPYKGETISCAVRIKVVEHKGATDIVSTRFEYSADGVTWTEIGTDTDGKDGWSVKWDTYTVPVGDYTIRATMADTDGLTGSDSVTVTVIRPEGGIGVAVLPKVSTVKSGTTSSITIKVVSTENFDDVFKVHLDTEGIPDGFKADLTWFNWTSKEVWIESGGQAVIPLNVSFPGWEAGYKGFRAVAASTRCAPVQYDTGILVIT